MSHTAFVTGGTGIIGSYLIEVLLKAGWRVVTLARSSNALSASSRVTQILPSSLDEDLQRVEVVTGDVTHPFCGLDEATIVRLRGKCQVFWHCAGDTRFAARHKDSIQRTNIAGTSNAVATAKVLGIENFCHVSTAFVFGDFAGVGVEWPHPDVGQCFNNPYEESKFLSERLVTDAHLNWIIFRPPIVVGDSKSGMISGFTGYYGLAREFWRLKHAAENGSGGDTYLKCEPGLKVRGERLHLPIDVPGHHNAVLTIASVDFVVEAMVALAQLPQAWRQVYHLVPNKSRTYGWWLDTTLEFLGIEGVRVAEQANPCSDRSWGRHRTLMQRRIAQTYKPYLPYISGGTTFKPANLTSMLPTYKHHRIDEQFVALLLRHAVRQRFGEKNAVPARHHSPFHHAPLQHQVEELSY